MMTQESSFCYYCYLFISLEKSFESQREREIRRIRWKKIKAVFTEKWRNMKQLIYWCSVRNFFLGEMRNEMCVGSHGAKPHFVNEIEVYIKGIS